MDLKRCQAGKERGTSARRDASGSRGFLLAACALVALAGGLVGSRPAAVEAAGATAVSAGGDHTCALIAAPGGVKCWGGNSSGQLGNDAASSGEVTPQTVCADASCTMPLSQIVGVSAGTNHSCALTDGGGLKCWGDNWAGQLGDGTSGNVRTAPVDVCADAACAAPLAGVVAVATGYAHTCAVTTAGNLICWGNNFHGQLGTGTIGSGHVTPVPVVGLDSKVAAIAAGDWHTCAIMTWGGLKCWGENLHGQIGDGLYGTNRLTPVDVVGMSIGVEAVTLGGRHSCALTEQGGVKCWGNNGYGQIGNGKAGSLEPEPVDVASSSTGVQAIVTGFTHTCALRSSGTMACWGRNDAGQLGDGQTCASPCTTPVDVCADAACATPLGGVTNVSAADHGCVVTAVAGVKCWGSNDAGQVGDGTTTDLTAPVDVLTFAVGGVVELPGVPDTGLLQTRDSTSAAIATVLAAVIASAAGVVCCVRRRALS